MPTHKTFNIKPFKELIDQQLNKDYVDPFPYPYKQDAIEYLKTIDDLSVNDLVFDPPYSQRQLKEMYKNIGFSYDMNNSYWANCKDEIARITKINGKVLSFGWNSNGIGKTRGFEIKKIWLIAHGSMHNDTIITLEIKVK